MTCSLNPVRKLALVTAPVMALAGLVLHASTAASDPLAAPAIEAAPTQDCDSESTIVYGADPAAEPSCPDAQNDSIETDRAYLVETATPGYTMMRQGPELAVARLHPEFVHRLAAAIREARQAGLSTAGTFSAYRPPAFGVGGFTDKFNSLHTYGLAVDMAGIGGPGSAEAKTWYEIADKHGVICPYGFEHRVEWNHCQPTRIKIILAQNPLRETVTADGPVDLASMFEAGSALIRSPAGDGNPSAESLSERSLMARLESSERREPSAKRNELPESESGGPRASHLARLIHIGSLPESPSWCKHLHHPDKATCGGAHPVETAANKKQAAHSRQASVKTSRDSKKL
jgi:hypothetical protein